MKQLDYDNLLNSLDDKSKWLTSGGLAGTSETLRRFVAEVVSTQSELVAACDDGCGIVLLVRSGATPRLDAGLLSLLGVSSHALSIVDLYPAADIFNQGQLFGVGKKKGVFEEAVGPAIIIRGVEHLVPTALQRLGVFVSVWRKHLQVPVVFLTTHSVKQAGSDECLQNVLSPRILHLPALRDRPDDIPWAIHEAATQHAGGLDQFDPDAVELLRAHSWVGDLAELNSMVSSLFDQADANATIRFGAHDIQNVVKRTNRISFELESLSLQKDANEIWNSIHELIDAVDEGTRRLLGVSFFAADTIPVQRAPFSGLWPELNFAKLISWSYMKFFEAGNPNLRCVLKLVNGANISRDSIKDVLETIDRLRTLEQHQLLFTSDRDMATIQTANSWFERKIGRQQPEEKDFEKCIQCFLLDINSLLEAVAKFIRWVEHDEFRDVTLQQWHHMRDNQWERHRFEAIVTRVVESLSRDDLNVRVITDRLLTELQQQLSACADDVDKPRFVAALVEQKIADDFPRTMPVTGEDMIRLGIQRGPKVGQILGMLKTHFNKTGASREQLLELGESLLSDLR